MSHGITHHLQDGLRAREAQGATEGPSSDSRPSAATCGFPENGILAPGRGWGVFQDWTGMDHKELLLDLSFIHSLTHPSDVLRLPWETTGLWYPKQEFPVGWDQSKQTKARSKCESSPRAGPHSPPKTRPSKSAPKGFSDNRRGGQGCGPAVPRAASGLRQHLKFRPG